MTKLTYELEWNESLGLFWDEAETVKITWMARLQIEAVAVEIHIFEYLNGNALSDFGVEVGVEIRATTDDVLLAHQVLWDVGYHWKFDGPPFLPDNYDLFNDRLGVELHDTIVEAHKKIDVLLDNTEAQLKKLREIRHRMRTTILEHENRTMTVSLDMARATLTRARKGQPETVTRPLFRIERVTSDVAVVLDEAGFELGRIGFNYALKGKGNIFGLYVVVEEETAHERAKDDLDALFEGL